MVECKYKLPCGRCDKRGALCDASEPTPTELKYDPNCNHDWLCESTTYMNPDLPYTYYSYTTYRCGKCKVKKFVYNFKT